MMPGGGSNDGLSPVADAAVVPERYVETLTRNDVLLGRGRPVVRWEGNIRFRRLVQNRKGQYRATGRNIVKDSIAREIIQTVHDREGRFLRKVESSEAIELGVPNGVQAWVVADDASVIQKVKQAFRDEQRAELESEGANSLSISERSHARLEERAASLPGSLEPQSPDAAHRIALLMNRGDGLGQHASLPPPNQNPCLQQTLSMLRATQPEYTSHHHLGQQLHQMNPYSQVSGNSNDLSQLRSLLAGGNGPGTLRDTFPREYPLLSMPGDRTDTLSNLLRARALADLQEERQRQEDIQRQEQLQGALAMWQHNRAGLSGASYGGGSNAFASNFGPHVAHHGADRMSMGTSAQGASALERELLVAQGRASLPFQSTDTRFHPTPPLAQQLASAQVLRPPNAPLYPPSEALLRNVGDQGDTAASLPLSAHTLASIQGIRDGTDRTYATDSSSRSSALEEWLRNHSSAGSESKRKDR